MQAFILLLGLGLVFVLVVFPIWAIMRISALGEAKDALAEQVRQLEDEMRELRARLTALASRSAEPPQRFAPRESVEPRAQSVAPLLSAAVPTQTSVATPARPADPSGVWARSFVEAQAKVEPPSPATACAVPSLPSVAAAVPPPLSVPPVSPPLFPKLVASEVPPPLAAEAAGPTPSFSAEPAPSASEEGPLSRINWEQFMGAKLFAWLGGLAGLLAVGFFVKYSFDHDLIPPEARVAIGFLFALGLIIGGLKLDRARYAVTAQTLIATGVVSLYTVTFACRSIYHFPFFGVIPTFLLMALITGAAFLLAVRLEAQVVAVLGILGGFLTPVLVSSGQDNALGLFGYLALLDLGLVAVALHRRWHYLVPLGAAGTILMQIAWAGKYFSAERLDTAVLICLVFAALFAAAAILARRRGTAAAELLWSAVAAAITCFGFGLFFVGYPASGPQFGLVFALALIANLCLLALAWFEERPALVPLAAAGTTLLLASWTAERVKADLAPTAMGVCLGFCLFFLGAYFAAARAGRAAREITWSAVALPFVGFILALALNGFPEIAARPGLLFTFVLAADACLLAIAWCDDELPKLHFAAGMAVFLLLAVWTGARLTAPLLPWGLAFYLLYAALHTAFPLLLERRRPSAAPTWWSQLFPPLTLLVMLLPLFRLPELSLLFWPCVLLVDLLAIGLALITASLAAVGAVLALTLVATGVWILQVPVATAAPFSLLLVIGGFAVLFFAAGIFLVRRLGDRLATSQTMVELGALGDARVQVPALSALLPFLLLIMMSARLPLADPSPIFGLALLLVGLVLGLTTILRGPAERPEASDSDRLAGIEWLPACALAGAAGLEYAWHTQRFNAGQAAIPLGWYLLFAALFAGFPFGFRRRFAACTGPWAVAAAGVVLQFPLVYWTATKAWPSEFPGLLPALFAVPPLLSLVAILRGPDADARARLNQLALFGGTALLFITLVFPIQFERQWLTLGWALEGAALLWLYHRVPHEGLRVVGAGLLVTAFVRLALNPAVFAYHARSSTAILNWYLYSYGLVTACLFAAAWLARPPRHLLAGAISGPSLFNTLGTILAFFLLNIEIADFFSEPGQRVLTFKFSGHFGRDMTYTIAWALFALGLLLMSIWKTTRAGRWAALVLLSVALLKLFFHDLARLGALHRIGALFAVAIIATLASFAYQRFLPANEKNTPPK